MGAKGKLIVIEGTDGSGKATQSQRLLKRLEEEGFLTAYSDFPRYGQKSAGMVENYLNGKYGSADDVDPRVGSIFYAIDRYDASFDIKKSLNEGRIVVCNRYVSASMGHQGGKISDKDMRDAYLNWLEELEYNLFKIPKPDTTIFLYVPYLIAQKLVDNKAKREYIGDRKRDIHESDSEHLRKAELAYLDISKQKGWKLIDCTKDGSMLSVDAIHELIWHEVKKSLTDS